MSRFVYDKFTSPTRLHGTMNTIPAAGDVALTYKDKYGEVITDLNPKIKIIDAGSSNGVQRLKKASDGTAVNVFIGSTQIIGDPPIEPPIPPTPTQELYKIKITKLPTKLTYGTAETVSYNGLEFDVYWTSVGTETLHVVWNDTTRPANTTVNIQPGVPMNEWIVGQRSSTTGSGTVTVTYSHLNSHGVTETSTDTFDLMIADDEWQFGQATWEDSTGKFMVGEAFDPNGLKIPLYWKNAGFTLEYYLKRPYEPGSSTCQGLWTVPAKGIVFEDTGAFDGSIHYRESGHIGFFRYVVEEFVKKPIYISVKTAPTKTEYTVGETIDMSGLELRVAYNDGTIGYIGHGHSGLTYEPAQGTATTAGMTTVTIHYGECTCTQAIEVITAGFNGLCLTANEANSTVTLGREGEATLPWTGSYSTNGTAWNDYIPGTTGAITLTNIGDKVYFKGTQTGAFSTDACLHFAMTGSIAASGNCMSLWCGDSYETVMTIPYDNTGLSLFSQCDVLTSAPTLPATTLTANCYSGMFGQCTALTTPPALPATALAENCYLGMFLGCTALIVVDASGTGYDKAWRIPTAGTFTGSQDYNQLYMFYNCAVGRSRASDDMPGVVGQSYTYYTQNTPV